MDSGCLARILRVVVMSVFEVLLRMCLMFCLLNQGNVGLIFTKGDLKEVSEEVAKYKVM